MRKIMLFSVYAFAAGIAFRSFFDFGTSFALFLLLLGGALCACRLFQKKALFLIAGIFFIAAGLGILRFEVSQNPARKQALNPYVGETVLLEGVIGDEPDVRVGHTKLTVDVHSVSFRGNKAETAETKMLVIAHHYPEYAYGDSIRIRGTPQRPDTLLRAGNKAGAPFRYAAYLEKDGIYYEMFYPDIELLESGGGNLLKRYLFMLKRAYIKNLGRVLPEPHAALAGGITAGAKEALGEELLGIFRKAGIIHIVVLSGYNITIIAQAVGRGTVFLPRVAGLGLTAAAIALFAVMTGGEAAIVRASIMALLVLLARATGRISEIVTALFAAAFLMLFVNPKILAFDPSFQLSFLATFGLLFLAPKTEQLFRWLPARFGIREAASATAAAQFFVFPFLVYLMGEFSAVSFLVNILILPFVPLGMLFSFLSGSAAFLSVFVAAPFSYPAWAILDYILSVSSLFSVFPFAVFTAPLSFSAMAAVYIVFCVALFLLSRKHPD